MYEFLVCLLAILICAIFYFYYIRYTHFSELRCKGPTPLPIIGSALDIRTPSRILKTLLAYQKKYDSSCKVSVFFSSCWMVYDPDLIGFIMNNSKFNNKGDHYKYLHRWLGTGLLTSAGEKWVKHRKLLTPTFHFNILKGFVETFENLGDILVTKLRPHCDKGFFDIQRFINLYSLDVICETSMGVSIKAQDNSEHQYVKDVRDLLYLACTHGLTFYKRIEFMYYFTWDYWKECRTAKRVHSYTDSIIAKRKKNFVDFDDELMDEYGRKKKIAFLDLMLRSSIKDKSLTDLEIREEVDTFMFEAHDTSSSAITFIFYELSRNSEIQNKVYQEQLDIFHDIQRPATYDDLQKMFYLEQVIKEAIRLHPAVPMFSREVLEDISCDIGTIKAGTEIFIAPFGTHRMAKYFPDPLKFDPDRFSPENISKIKPFSYIPFSGGFRNCIGQKFAMLEIKSAVSKIIRNFEVLPDPDFELIPTFEVILRSVNPVTVGLRERAAKS